jgi:WXG100 family type VII secretion target
VVSFAVDPDGLVEIATHMRELDAWWEDTARRLDRLVDGLHADWTGAAADEHRQAHQRWASGSTTMRDALARLATVSARAHGNYRAAGRAGTAMWGAD